MVFMNVDLLMVFILWI